MKVLRHTFFEVIETDFTSDLLCGLCVLLDSPKVFSHLFKLALPQDRNRAFVLPDAAMTTTSTSAAPLRALAFGLPYDGLVAFATRALRMLNYGAIAPVFFLYCLALGFSEVSTGALLTSILVGDLAVTMWLTTRADSFGRRRTLVVGSALKVLAGAAFALSSDFAVLVAAGVVGVVSTSGGECGPFMAIEQAVLTDSVQALHAQEAAAAREAREAAGEAPAPAGEEVEGEEVACAEVAAAAKETSGRIAVVLGYYNAVGYLAQAAGAVGSGLAVTRAQAVLSVSALASYRLVFFFYGAVGCLMALLYLTISAEAKKRPAKAAGTGADADADAPKACCPSWLAPLLPNASFGLRRPESAYIVARLCVLFAMDSFAGAFVMQTWIALWFSRRWGFSSELVGYLLMVSNIVAGASGIAAAYFVKSFGPMLTMVASHFPSNLLLLAVPFMPSGWAAAAMLVARFCISQMDVPARQAYVTMVVASDERSAASGITNVIRSLGMAAAPSLVGYLSSQGVDASPLGGFTLFGSPWLIAGAIKCVYDVTLYCLYLFDNTMNRGVETAALKAGEEDRADRRSRAAAAEAAEAGAAGKGGGLAAPLLLK